MEGLRRDSESHVCFRVTSNMRSRVITEQDGDCGIQVIMCTQGQAIRSANLYHCTTTGPRDPESDIHNIKRMQK
jgi:hypothetical protein